MENKSEELKHDDMLEELEELEHADIVNRVRKVVKRALAFDALLAEAVKSPVLICYRGITSKQEKLWEVTNRDGKYIAALGTIEQVEQSLYNAEGY